MFEKEADFAETKMLINCNGDYSKKKDYKKGWQDGAEFGYNKANEDARLKLKDEGIVNPLKDSILRNERLSSQEQQELCAWIECAMDFGENLDECAKELEEVNKANEWHYVKDGDLPKENKLYFVAIKDNGLAIAYFNGRHWETKFNLGDFGHLVETVIAWCEIPTFDKE